MMNRSYEDPEPRVPSLPRWYDDDDAMPILTPNSPYQSPRSRIPPGFGAPAKSTPPPGFGTPRGVLADNANGEM